MCEGVNDNIDCHIQAGHEPIDAGAVVELATTEACSYVLVVPQCLYGNLVSRLEPGLAESALLLQALIEVRSMDLTIFFFHRAPATHGSIGKVPGPSDDILTPRHTPAPIINL